MNRQDRVLLAVDLSNWLYRSAAAHSSLSFGDVFTGGLYGFMVCLAKMILETEATHCVVTRDCKPYRRSLVYPEYKRISRKNKDEDLAQAVKESEPLVLEMLQVVGIPTMGEVGFESDDCIGVLARDYRHRFARIYAASNDNDLYQLLVYPQFRILKGTSRSDIIGYGRLSSGPMGMTPDEFMLAQALQGTHNDVTGIPGIGPVKAYKAVKTPGALRALREQHGALIDRNLMLSRLPHAECPKMRLPSPGRFDPRALYRFCAPFNIDATKSMLDAFDQVAAK